jgi:hypothetical protein
MHRSKIADGIYLVRFRTQYELAATFLRFQEHFESSRFSNRIFTLEEFMDWYAATFGKFSYFEDWIGFNVPSKVLEPFYRGRFDPLLEKERAFLDRFRDTPRPFYIIGTIEDGAENDVEHEIAHALFAMQPPYRTAVQKAMRPYDTSALENRLHRLGYARHVLRDEAHAYLLTHRGPRDATTRAFAPLRRELRALFREHAADVLSKVRPSKSRRKLPRARSAG